MALLAPGEVEVGMLVRPFFGHDEVGVVTSIETSTGNVNVAFVAGGRRLLRTFVLRVDSTSAGWQGCVYFLEEVCTSSL